jgi:hypothetical protein
MDSQRAVTRALLCHESLTNVLASFQRDISEKDEALQSAIVDKMRLTELLAESMNSMSPMSTKGGNKSFSPMITSTIPKSDQFVLMESHCYIIDITMDTWK